MLLRPFESWIALFWVLCVTYFFTKFKCFNWFKKMCITTAKNLDLCSNISFVSHFKNLYRTCYWSYRVHSKHEKLYFVYLVTKFLQNSNTSIRSWDIATSSKKCSKNLNFSGLGEEKYIIFLSNDFSITYGQNPQHFICDTLFILGNMRF